MPESSGPSLAKRTHLESGKRLIQVARSLLVAVSPLVLLTLGGKGSMEVSAPDVSLSAASS